VVVDFGRYPAGARVRLRNTLGAGGTAEVLAFDVASGPAARDDTRIPDRLSTIPALDPAVAAVTRTFLFQNAGDKGWTINGAAYDPAHPLATPRLGRLERWRFVTDLHHPIHLHLDPFQVLGRNGDGPGWAISSSAERLWPRRTDDLIDPCPCGPASSLSPSRSSR
jgi:FtsP/CotA-like multicopper oxidase with cupredoxin domain